MILLDFVVFSSTVPLRQIRSSAIFACFVKRIKFQVLLVYLVLTSTNINWTKGEKYHNLNMTYSMSYSILLIINSMFILFIF